MTVQIVTAGRNDVDDFFKMTDVFAVERLSHTPLFVFIATESTLQVRLLNRSLSGQPVTDYGVRVVPSCMLFLKKCCVS